MTKRTSMIGVVAATLLAGGQALAQDAKSPAAPAAASDATEKDRIVTVLNKAAADQSIFDFSYSSPNSPVLPLVGTAADQITRVDSLKKFGVGLLNGFGAGGTSPAVAIEISPYWLLASQSMNLAEYEERSGLERVLARSKLAFAFSQGDKATSRPSSLVLSFATKLLDSSDGLLIPDFAACIDGPYFVRKRAINSRLDDWVASQNPRPSIEAEELQRVKIEAELNAVAPMNLQGEYDKCVAEHSKALAARSSLDIGAGLRLNGSPGSLEKLHGSGGIVWATWASGVIGGSPGAGDDPRAGPLAGFRARAVAHVRYSFNEEVFDDKFALQGKRDALMIVAGIESVPNPAKPETVRWSLQAGWNRQNKVLPTEEDKRYWRYLGKLDFRMMEGLWLTASLGRASGRGIKSDTTALLGFAFSLPGARSKVASFYDTRN